MSKSKKSLAPHPAKTAEGPRSAVALRLGFWRGRRVRRGQPFVLPAGVACPDWAVLGDTLPPEPEPAAKTVSQEDEI